MDGNITINIVEPGTPPSPTPIDPVAPNTGLFTSGTSNPEATIITAISAVLILTIVAIVITSLLYRKQKKSGKVTKLVHLVDSTKAVLKSNKHITTAVILLAILTSTGTFIALAKNAVNASENDEQSQTEGTNDSSLTVDVSSEELTIEVGDEPVFAIFPVEVTVEEATEAGYTLTAYTDNTDLVSTTDSSKVIPMVAADEGELVALANNTYGLALEEKPTTKDEAVYTTLSTDLSNPTTLKAIDDYSSTPANDTTTIYYGFYITPDVPYGTYKGSTISYEAIPNLATISYNANGLYYNNDESFTTNTVGYKPSTPDSPIEELTGEYLAPTPLTPVDPSSPIHYTFLGWSKTEGATTPDYEDEEDIIANLTLSPNEDLTLYAVWHYDTVLSFNGNTSDGGEAIADITIPAGTTITLPPNTYTRTGSVFTNWNTVAEPTEQDPGEDYEDEADFTAPDSSADITLYAQWAYYTTITFNGNGADSGSMSPQDIIAGTPENLVPNAYTKTNHTFIGWNTVQYPTPENPGTTYQDQAEFIADATQHEDITLYAQWAATTIAFNGNTSESGTMNPITIPGGEQVTLPQNAYTKSHCTFTSWNTNPDGTGTRYPGEASYTASMDGIYSFTLYAQWQCESMINFSGNGADSGYMPGIMATGGQQTTLPQNTFTKDGYSFNGWNTSADGTGESYPDQGTYIAPVSESQNITLYVQWLPTTTITFNGNGETSGSMVPQTIVAGTPQNLTPNAYAKDGYIFNGWNTSAEGTGTSYADKASYSASTTEPDNFTLYAQWVVPPTNLTFTAGEHINTLMVADSSKKWKPFYITPTSTDRSIVFTAPVEGTKYIITVVPEAGYVLSSDSTNSSYEVAFSTGTLASNTLLTTTYTAGSAGNSIAVSAASADSDSAHSAYTTMQSLTAAQCPAYTDSAQGINVTDSRDNKSYTVAKFGNSCYMLSNLRLDGGTELDASSSHVSSSYTLPADTGSSGWYNDYCKPYMASKNGEYYYNWPAATARTNSTSGTAGCSNDTRNSVGYICPAGWILPDYEYIKSITPAALWNNGANPGMLSTSGYFYSGSQSDVGGYGDWWSSTRSDNDLAYYLRFDGASANRRRHSKYIGRSVRCVRSS